MSCVDDNGDVAAAADADAACCGKLPMLCCESAAIACSVSAGCLIAADATAAGVAYVCVIVTPYVNSGAASDGAGSIGVAMPDDSVPVATSSPIPLCSMYSNSNSFVKSKSMFPRCLARGKTSKAHGDPYGAVQK